MLVKRLLKDSLVYGLGGIASRFIGFLLVPIYTRLLSPSEYGLLDILMTLGAVLGLLSGLQVESGVARDFYEARDRGQLRPLIGTALWLYSAGALIAAVAAVAIFRTWFYGHAGISWAEFMPVLFSLLPTQSLGLLMLLLRFDKRSVAYTMVALGDVICTAAFGLSALCWFHFGVKGIVWSVTVSKLLWSLGVALVFYRPYILGWSTSHAGSILAYSIPLIPNVLISWIQNYGNRFIILRALTLASVGLFGVATSVASIVMVPVMAFRMAWDPIATELMGRDESRAVYARTFEYYMLFTALACAAVGSIGDSLIKVLAPPAYAAAGPIVTFLCMGYLWIGSIQILGLGINVVRKTYWGVISYASGLLVNLGLLWLGVRHGGLPMAGATFLLGAVATSLVMYFISQKCFFVPYNRIMLLNMILFSISLSYLFLRWEDWFSRPSSLLGQTICRSIVASILWGAMAMASLRKEDRSKLLLLRFRRRVTS